jgi:CO dehydrogenase maturation factor
MKLSVSGKGGSGKSTVTTLLALELRNRGVRPVIVDSDESNSVLYRMLGMAKPPQPLVALAGGRHMVRTLMPPGYTPAESGKGTHVLTQSRILLDDLPSENMIEKDNLRLIVVGKIAEPLEGCACPMGVLGREFLSKLKLRDNEIALVDMEAGIEHFGRGVESGLDAVLIVVEPSFESISLAERIQYLAHGIGVPKVGAVLNKINSELLSAKLCQELKNKKVEVIGAVPYDKTVFNADLEGLALSIGQWSIAEALHNISNWILH